MQQPVQPRVHFLLPVAAARARVCARGFGGFNSHAFTHALTKFHRFPRYCYGDLSLSLSLSLCLSLSGTRSRIGVGTLTTCKISIMPENEKYRGAPGIAKKPPPERKSRSSRSFSPGRRPRTGRTTRVDSTRGRGKRKERYT